DRKASRRRPASPGELETVWITGRAEPFENLQMGPCTTPGAFKKVDCATAALRMGLKDDVVVAAHSGGKKRSKHQTRQVQQSAMRKRVNPDRFWITSPITKLLQCV